METTKRILEEIESNGFSVCDNFIPLSEAEVILSKIIALRRQNQFRQAGIGNKSTRQTNASIRSDNIFWLEKDDEQVKRIFFKKTDQLIIELNRRFYLCISDYEFHLAHYSAGAFYKKHRDAFKNDDARKISMILYLNTSWKKGHGGELKLYPENGNERIIEPIAGRLVIFESRLEHEVLESKADRYSLTGWLKNKSRSF